MGAKRTKKLKISKDRISELPEEILYFTLSLLSLREAARTSILSSRWRYLWKTSSRSLSLDLLAMKGSSQPNCGSARCENGKRRNRLLRTERSEFIGWVNQILQLDYSPTLDSFRLRFYMKREFARLIDKWISVAIAKRVQKIYINLSPLDRGGNGSPDKGLYPFPCRLFTVETGSLVKCLCLNSCTLEPPEFHCFSSLVDLHLENIPIAWDKISKFLATCPNLEKLSLAKCRKLSCSRICFSSLKLLSLSVGGCFSVREIEIDARNLTRLEYWGGPVKFSFLNAPQLSNVAIRNMLSDFSSPLRHALRSFSSDLPKLESLILSVKPIQELKIPRRLPLFVNLKKLVLIVVMTVKNSLWSLIPLFMASPYLQRLEVHLHFPTKYCEEVGRPSDTPHLHLKEIMLSGFRGTSHEFEFAKYLRSNSPVLENLTIDRHPKFFSSKPSLHYTGDHFYDDL